jgi:hypothetical protein
VILAGGTQRRQRATWTCRWGRTTQVALPVEAFCSAARAWGLSNLRLMTTSWRGAIGRAD